MKRIIAFLCVLVLLLSVPVYAKETEPIISADSVTADAGTTIDVPIRITGNTGILGAKITVQYDNRLTLTKVVSGEAFEKLVMTKPGDLKANPINIVWDGIDDAAVADGVIAILTFQVPAAAGDYTISLSSGQQDTIDADLKPVRLEMRAGMIKVGKGKQRGFSVDRVCIGSGNTVAVPIRINGNTGILGAKITVQYDKELTLTNISAGEAFAKLVMTTPGDLKANPISVVWDGIDEAAVTDGVVAVLHFTTPKKNGEYPISVSCKSKDILDENLFPVSMSVQNGCVHRIGDCSSATDVVLPSSTTIVSEKAFYGHQKMKSVTIPESVRLIEANAFGNCSGLSTVYYYATVDDWNAIEIKSGNDAIKNAKRYQVCDVKLALGDKESALMCVVGERLSKTDLEAIYRHRVTLYADVAMTRVFDLTNQITEMTTLYVKLGAELNDCDIFGHDLKPLPKEEERSDADGKIAHYKCLRCNTLFEDAAGKTLIVPVRVLGDMDGNGKVEASDAILILKHLVGLLTLDEEQLAAADVDGSGKLTTIDAVYILRFAADLIQKFPAV